MIKWIKKLFGRKRTAFSASIVGRIEPSQGDIDRHLEKAEEEHERMRAALLPHGQRCAKCGSDDIVVKYEGVALPFVHVIPTFWPEPGHPERLKRTCARCGYTWYERTKDASDE